MCAGGTKELLAKMQAMKQDRSAVPAIQEEPTSLGISETQLGFQGGKKSI